MGSFVEFLEVTGTIIGTVGLALALEWAALYGLTSLMPERHGARRTGRS